MDLLWLSYVVHVILVHQPYFMVYPSHLLKYIFGHFIYKTLSEQYCKQSKYTFESSPQYWSLNVLKNVWIAFLSVSCGSNTWSSSVTLRCLTCLYLELHTCAFTPAGVRSWCCLHKKLRLHIMYAFCLLVTFIGLVGKCIGRGVVKTSHYVAFHPSMVLKCP